MPGARVREVEKKLLDLEACLNRVGARLEDHIRDSTVAGTSPGPSCHVNHALLPTGPGRDRLPNRSMDEAFSAVDFSNDGTELRALDSHQWSLTATDQPPVGLGHLLAQQFEMDSKPTAMSSRVSEITDACGIDSLPADLLISLTDLYFKHINPWCPILGRERTFERLFGAGAGDVSQRLLLYAIVASSLPLSDDDRLTPESREHIQQTACKEVHHRALAQMDVVALQALLILSLASLDGPDGRPALAGITLVARIVVQFGLGLTRDPSNEKHPVVDKVQLGMLPPPRGWIEEEERRRLFWMAYIIDRYATMIWGTPPNIEIKDINTQLPCRYDLFVGNRRVVTKGFCAGLPVLSSIPKGTNQGSFSYHCDLLHFAARIQHFLDQPIDLQSSAEVEEWHATLWQLDTELRTWIDELPGEHGSISRLCHSDPTSRISNWIVLHGAIIIIIIRLHSPAACPMVHSAAFPPSDAAIKRCLSAVESARCIIQEDVNADMLKLLGPLFATCLWVSCRFLIIHNSYQGDKVLPELETFLTTLDSIGDTWQVAKGYSRILRQVCSDIKQLEQAASATSQSTWGGYDYTHPIVVMRE